MLHVCPALDVQSFDRSTHLQPDNVGMSINDINKQVVPLTHEGMLSAHVCYILVFLTLLGVMNL